MAVADRNRPLSRRRAHGLPAYDDVRPPLEKPAAAASMGAHVRALHRRSSDHPLHLRELAQALVYRQINQEAWLPDDPLEGLLPPLLRELILRRSEQLSPKAIAVAQIACLLEGEPELRLLAMLCGCDREQLLSHLDELMRAGLMGAPGSGASGWHFSHGLVRETFHDRLSVQQRATLHLQIGDDLLARAGDRSEAALTRAAHHLREALPLGDPGRVARVHRAAARMARGRGAPVEAAELQERACELAEQYGIGSERDRLAQLMALGRSYLACGFRHKTLRAYGQAIETARALGRRRIQVEATLGLSAAVTWGHPPDSNQERYLVEALSLVQPGTAAHARLVARQALCRCHRGGSEAEIRLAREAVRLAARYRNGRDPRAFLEANRALYEALQGPAHRQERARVAEQLLGPTWDAGPAAHTFSLREALAGERLMCGDRPGHDALLTEGREHARRHPQFAWLNEVARGSAALLDGRLCEAEQHMHRSLQLGAVLDNPEVKRVFVGQRLQLYRLRGRPEQVREDIEALTGPLSWLGDYPDAIRAAFYVEVGDTAAAWDIYAPLVIGWLKRSASAKDWLITAAELAFLCARLGDVERASQLAERLRPYAAWHAVHPGENHYRGPISRYLGLLAAAQGRRSEAITWMEQARAACAEVGAGAYRGVIEGDLQALRAGARKGQSVHAGEPQLRMEQAPPSVVQLRPSQPPLIAAAAAKRVEDGWLLRFDGKEVHARHLIGLRYLVELLARPGCKVAARALVDNRNLATLPAGAGATASQQGLTLVEGHDMGPALDQVALQSYRKRLRDLEADLNEAQANCDLGRAERLQLEQEALRQELSRALNRFGRARRSGSRDERTRVSCTRAIRKAIEYLHRVHPALGQHLQGAIHTGNECAYKPQLSLTWDCQM